MIGPVFGVYEIPRVAVPLTLGMLEEGAFKVEIRSVGCDFVLVEQQVCCHEPLCRFQAAVEVYGAEDGFEDIPKDGRASPPAGEIFFPTEIKEITDSNFLAYLGEHGFAYEQGLDLRKRSLAFILVTSIEIFRDDQVQHGVTKEFQTLVGGDTVFFIRVDVGTMLKGEIKQVRV